MNREANNRIPDIAPSLPDEEQERTLREALDWLEMPGLEKEQGVTLSPEEVDRLRTYSRERGTNVRRLAVEFLVFSYDGQISWDDFRAWCLDPERDIRSLAMSAVDLLTRPLGKMCNEDKLRCAQILAESVDWYPDGEIELRRLVNESDEWLEAIWLHIGQLLETGRTDLYNILTAGLIQEVLEKYNWEPDDPHIFSWINGDEIVKKMALLAVTRWLQLEKDNLKDITETLARDPDAVIAQIAKAIIADHSGRFGLKLDDYQTVKSWLATRDGQE